MTSFLLNNNEVINTNVPQGSTLLDFIRYHKRLTGTKIGCREGDCGACTVLVGSINNDGELIYNSMTSCLMPLGNAQGKHIVTIEGLNLEELSPVQKAIVEEGGTQCGFCTVGFVMSFAGFCLENKEANFQNGIAAIDGNICRCTGYKSLERATKNIVNSLENKNIEDPIEWLVENNFVPSYFSNVKENLLKVQTDTNHQPTNTDFYVGGGTDLFVQQPETIAKSNISTLLFKPSLKVIEEKNNTCFIGASVTVEEFRHSTLIQKHFPNVIKHTKLVSSTPIRNMATFAGNFVNASPIGDMTIFFLALNTGIQLTDMHTRRELKLKDFYKGYKKLDKDKNEIIENLFFELPNANTFFNFEKVSKRTHLDIATVNSAISIEVENDLINKIGLAAGGVGPIPLFLQKTCDFLTGKKINHENINKANEIAQQEISPISDVRGSESYKRLLLRQLIFAHFIELFPEKIQLESLV